MQRWHRRRRRRPTAQPHSRDCTSYVERWTGRTQACTQMYARTPQLQGDLRASPPTSAPGLGSPCPHLHRDRAQPSHIAVYRDWAHPCLICTRTGLTQPSHIAVYRDWAHPCHTCTGTGPPLRYLHRDQAHSHAVSMMRSNAPQAAGVEAVRPSPVPKQMWAGVSPVR